MIKEDRVLILRAERKEETFISLDKDIMKRKTLLPFYIYVAECMGYEGAEIESYDCTKIWVAENVQDAIMEAYREEFPTVYAKYPIDVDQEIMSILAICGPKVNEKLSDNQVKVEAGFIILKDTKC